MTGWVKILFLFVAGIAAGLTNSMAGMGSVFSYPALLALGLPPVNADVTNTAALVFTGVSSTVSSKQELHGNWKVAWINALTTIVGGIFGAWILITAPAESFQKLVPFFILAAGVLMLLSNRKKQKTVAGQAVPAPSRWRMVGRTAAIFVVGLYMGYFGASSGVIMLAVLSFTSALPFAVNNSIKNFSSLMTNFISLFVYAIKAKIYWLLVWPMGAGLFIGGYLGPIFIRHIPVHLMRTTIAVAAFIVAGVLFVQAY
ncbi:sulfite exporter TauE/SafE family protein [Lacticaseibacillus zhaodongensis]|uniref:sulfite exporter TauE/SafE family protein n=1 Tax=Lacticaseibacillus zhaodongensis TaxID=2668065 RepID=UPI0012D3721F|nr:sulfite exporter TauE/SafE family protein [Lacticaseibacillus zhaodongensis]